jgi:cytochrome c oxidase cbb3-type subunit I
LAVGAISFLVAKAMGIVGTFRSVSELTHLTTYADAIRHLELYGFIGMTFAGVVYYLVPKLSQVEWPSLGLIRFHFWAVVIGVALIFAGYLAGGLRLGAGINNPEISFLALGRSLIPFFGLVTLGLMLVGAGYLAMLINLVKICRIWAANFFSEEAPDQKTSAAGATV